MAGILSLNDVSFRVMAQFEPIHLAKKIESKNYRMDFKLAIYSNKITEKNLETKFYKRMFL